MGLSQGLFIRGGFGPQGSTINEKFSSKQRVFFPKPLSHSSSYGEAFRLAAADRDGRIEILVSQRAILGTFLRRRKAERKFFLLMGLCHCLSIRGANPPGDAIRERNLAPAKNCPNLTGAEGGGSRP
jgi:hypothetical protein